ncbi:3',5'-cyclic-nucleotide phosphodiesterase [Motiliproteus sp. MSK22-1]|uniref:3',5'-cyclic-nucleotide phosphodiesterase n=1 Tax=Motiliproteus sp. MSK22-1 TaxID=1897630 RepID=UPI000976B23B|nr:3',5'-cyclic-nucleotide phosphodiesterase [Motiliproteus sp. MSK22-1]OMH38102.1 hypothetical protein BGP75_07460 [Motiliproteus sp. MSK22-1]
MRIEVLGCSGGIGAGLKTTCIKINDSILIDAGTGLELLSTEAMLKLRHIFFTHAHLDHICCLPLMLPTIYDRLKQPLHIHASDTVISALRDCIFNWTVWPDYTQLPDQAGSLLRFREMPIDSTISLEGLLITALAVNHPTPTQGYLIESSEGAFAFSGDTASTPEFLSRLYSVKRLMHLAVDVSFPSEQKSIAKASGHYTPASLKADLDRWPEGCPKPSLHITHLKPGYEDRVMEQCQQLLSDWNVLRLRSGDQLTFESDD